LLTTIGSRWIVGVQAKRQAGRDKEREQHERNLARLADERTLRDAKQERLRRDYVDLGYAAQTIRDVAVGLMVLFAGETEEGRAKRLNDRLEEATGELGRAVIRLQLESGTRPLLDAYDPLRSKWYEYSYYVEAAERTHDHSNAAEAIAIIESEVKDIIAMARTDLDALAKPI
jgi:hypothetical protein